MASGLLPKSPVSSSLCDEVPSHIYSKIASRAQRIFDQQCKKTFATISAKSGHRPKGALGKMARFCRKGRGRHEQTFPELLVADCVRLSQIRGARSAR